MMNRAGLFAKLAFGAALALTVTSAAAQLKPWPDQQPQQPQPQTRAWPGESQTAPAPQAAAAPPPPMAVAPPPPMMGGGFGAPPPAQRESPCIAEFTHMRGEVEKAGKVAKAVNDKHGSREEFCKAFTNLHAAQVRWVVHTEKNGKNCGIPPDVLKQLKLVEANLGKMKNNVCNGGAVAGGGAPSLSEALGTAKLPVPDNDAVSKKRGGTLDTLTGEPIR
jgi:hypothetical protein